MENIINGFFNGISGVFGKPEEKVVVEPKNGIDLKIEALESTLQGLDPASEDFNTVVIGLERLYALKKVYAEAKNEEAKAEALEKSDIDINNLINCGGMLLVTLLCLNFERFGVITTKAFSFIPRFLRRV